MKFLLLLFFLFFPTFVNTAPKIEGKEPADDYSEICPAFLVNCPAVVEDEESGEESDVDESKIDSDNEYSDDDLTEKDGKFLFYVDTEKRGILDDADANTQQKNLSEQGSSENAEPGASSSDAHTDNGLVLNLFNRLATTGYNQEHLDSPLKNSLALCICLNKFKSLSSKKNAKLNSEMDKFNNCPSVDKSRIRAFPRFWNLCWKRKDIINAKARKKQCKYNDILSYYHQLKKKGKELAKKFRQQNEKATRRQVPYRALRESLRVHTYTADLVSQMRVNFSVIYFTIADGDTISFNKCFSSYVDHIRKNGIYEALEAGILFVSDEKFIEWGTTIDMAVRNITSKYFPLGVYYSEPGCPSLKIEDGKDTIEESFEIKKSNGDVEEDYETPNESVNLLKDLFKKRENPNLIFLNNHPVETKVPHRALQQKTKKKDGSSSTLSFEGKFDIQTGKFKKWTIKDLVTLSHITQSHINPRDWATNLLSDLSINLYTTVNCPSPFNIEVNTKTFKIEKNVGLEVRQIAISLISRLFGSYSPISLAKAPNDLLNNYNSATKQDDITSVERNRKSRQKTKKKRSTASIALWTEIDKIESRTELKNVLKQLICGESKELVDKIVEDIDEAAKSACLKIKEMLEEELTF